MFVVKLIGLAAVRLAQVFPFPFIDENVVAKSQSLLPLDRQLFKLVSWCDANHFESPLYRRTSVLVILKVV